MQFCWRFLDTMPPGRKQQEEEWRAGRLLRRGQRLTTGGQGTCGKCSCHASPTGHPSHRRNRSIRRAVNCVLSSKCCLVRTSLFSFSLSHFRFHRVIESPPLSRMNATVMQSPCCRASHRRRPNEYCSTTPAPSGSVCAISTRLINHELKYKYDLSHR